MPRVGWKRSDRRWLDPNGVEWASKFEWEVYERFRLEGFMVRKCHKAASDTFSYTTNRSSCACLECGSSKIVQHRTYTPDLFVDTDKGLGTSSAGGFYVETKGYFSAEKRSLLRAFAKERDDIDLRVLAQSNAWVTKGKSRLSDYFKRYLKNVQFAVWRKAVPTEWR